MRLVSAKNQKFEFLASDSEKKAWCDLLQFYPLQMDVVQPQGKLNAADQALLKEALQTERQTHRRELDALLQNEGNFVKQGQAFRLTLKPGQVEMLLQILNDLRVGSWHALGCPTPLHQEPIRLDANRLKHFWIMELAGRFQMLLLNACDSAAS